MRLRNPTEAVAFFIELRQVDGADQSFLPVLWDDNYVSLLPGEERRLRVRAPGAGSLDGAFVKAAGWNVPEAVVKLERGIGRPADQQAPGIRAAGNCR